MTCQDLGVSLENMQQTAMPALSRDPCRAPSQALKLSHRSGSSGSLCHLGAGHHRLENSQSESLLHNLNQTSLLSSGKKSMVLPYEMRLQSLEHL